MFEELRQFFRDNPRMPWVVGAALLVGIVFVWGAWGGFTLEIGRFFAAEVPTPTASPVSTAAPTVAPVPTQALCTTTINRGPGACPTGDAVCYGVPEGCGWSDGSPAYSLRVGHVDLDPVSGLSFNVGRGDPNDHTTWDWSYPPSTIEEWCDPNFSGGGKASPPPQAPALPGTARCPDGSNGGKDYSAYPYCGRDLIETVEVPCSAVQTQSLSTPLAVVYEAVQCTPAGQTVRVGEVAFFQASGGDGTFVWDAGPGAIQEEDEGFPGFSAFSWVAAGAKTVTVRSAGQLGYCTVAVQQQTSQIPPTAAEQTGPVGLLKQVRNITVGQTAFRDTAEVREGQRIQFSLRVTDREGDGTGELLVRDTLPRGMSYVPDSTTSDGRSVGDGITSGGIALEALPAGGERTVRWLAIADRLGELPLGPETIQAEAAVQTTEEGVAFVQPSGVTLTLYGTGTGSGGPLGGAGAVPTGPGEAVLLALALAAAGSLLYAAHTRSPAFHRREADRMSRRQDPLDFRS